MITFTKAKELHSEDGVVAIETSIILVVIFLFIMVIYELLKFQMDLSVMYVNEATASERYDVSVSIKVYPDNIGPFYMNQLNLAKNSEYFNALRYSEVSVKCYLSLDSQLSSNCNPNTRIIKLGYQVERLFVNKFICDLLKLPITFRREVVIINDYYF